MVETDLDGLAAGQFDPMSVVLVIAPDAAVDGPSISWGRSEDQFAHRDGMITKAEVRSIVLGALVAAARRRAVGRRRRQRLGGRRGGDRRARRCGCSPSSSTTDDAARITANAAAAGVSVNVEVVVGRAPAALDQPARSRPGVRRRRRPRRRPGVLGAAPSRRSPGCHVRGARPGRRRLPPARRDGPGARRPVRPDGRRRRAARADQPGLRLLGDAVTRRRRARCRPGLERHGRRGPEPRRRTAPGARPAARSTSRAWPPGSGSPATNGCASDPGRRLRRRRAGERPRRHPSGPSASVPAWPRRPRCSPRTGPAPATSSPKPTARPTPPRRWPRSDGEAR